MLATLAAAAAIAPAAPAVSVGRVKTFDHLRIVAAAGAPTGNIFAISEESGRVRIMDAAKLQTVHTLDGHPQTAFGLSFSPNGRVLASADETARIYLWDVKSGKKIREFSRQKGHTRGVQSIAWSKDSKMIATVGKDDVLHVWSVNGQHPIGTILGKGANLYGAAFMPSNALAVGTLADGLRLYKPKTYDLISTMPVPGGQGVNDIAMNKGGTLAVAAGRDGKLSVFDIRKRTRLASMPGHMDWAIRTTLAPNGRLAATSSSDRTVRVWDVKAMKEVAKLEDMSMIGSPLAFTGNGRYMIAANAADQAQVFAVTPPANR